ncbi:phenylalanine--tRNA ligase subunit beta [Vulcanibacillus modesticaldus]|uniref:Phenylalanine--tRNA ligase beta subunit n=1 Tax=Vulcanibacillus modesticaldus TaxID=337097 RepID=A0A1D2YUF4_9BACI|nr:phenylalanine--tRNA ligase subunit beta [Vulcanibacillus modesticaldus]OEF99338.1 phenylalanine--tRNA ligase subunit beta [Vulcanibacillus modesticaldus]
MKVSYKWLSQYVDINDISPYELAEKLTRSGVAVDIVEEVGAEVENVVVGYVVEREKHPNAEKLSLCKVDVGEGEPLQIICGAKNVDKGQKVPVAKIGGRLPEGFKIKKAKLRGVESFGMICSAKELGINEKLLPKEKTEGILVLDNEAVVGEDIKPVLGLNDYILELDLTPNRPDCLSMIGVAYEVAAILDRDVLLPKDELGVKISDDNPVNVKIEAPEACTHYAARIVKNVKIAESPQWLQNRLIAAGIRPINNVVDITNFVMLEYGQPLHAFDLDRLDQPEIVVRMANPNEKITTLDDQERELDDQMLLITDGVKPIAIAGVMGGANSEVTGETTQILLESAFFKGSSIRRTSRKLGLRSEASLRFEKGIDPNRIYAALNRAAWLLKDIAGAEIVGDITEYKVEDGEERTIVLNPDKVNRVLGTNLQETEMIDIFRRLRFNVEKQQANLKVFVPTRRNDITIEEDLIEEIARLYGYDNIPVTLPSGTYLQGGLTRRQKLRRSIKNLLQSSGLNEVITYTLTGQKQLKIIQGLNKEVKQISLSMPMSEERQYLRTGLIPNLLEVAQYNVNRRNNDVHIYEMGATFISKDDQLTELPTEKWAVAGLITGSLPRHWQPISDKVDFYYVKGILENLFVELGIKDVEYQSVTIKGYHPGRTAAIYKDEHLLGYLGQLHPNLEAEYDLKETYVFELDLGRLMELANAEIEYKPLPKYPAIQRDIAIVVPKDLEIKELLKTIKESAKKLLESLTVFDVYTSEQLGMEKKSVAFSLTYRSIERTLTDEEVTKLHQKVIDTLQDRYHAELRK